MKKNLLKLKSVLWGTLLVVCISGCGKDTAYYVSEETSEASKVQESEVDTAQNPDNMDFEKAKIYVYVCGHVAKPGVYTLSEGSRVCDVFALAGGFTKEAATDYWNQARILADGEMIYVPSAEEVKNRQLVEEDGNLTNSDTDDERKVNINTASKEELMTIPGIGETKALAILAYRQENGPFSSLEEVKNVEGIKDGVFSKMKDYIKIN